MKCELTDCGRSSHRPIWVVPIPCLLLHSLCHDWRNRILRVFFIWLLCASSALADSVDVPRISDGTVDVDAILSSFEIAKPITTGAGLGQYSGKILGETFGASVSGDVLSGTFTLGIRSPNLSEHAIYMTAILLTDVVCLAHNRGVIELGWTDASVKVGTEWRVNSSCSTEPRMSILPSN